MKRIAFFDTKSYDKDTFDKFNKNYDIVYFESKLREQTAQLADGFDGVCAFVNDDICTKTIDKLYEVGINVLAMRSAGYNNVNIKAAFERISIVRVPAYSPHAVAEHAMALLLSLNRRIHKAYNRTREFNFSLAGLMGMDLYEKTAGIIGTGKIGRIFIDICRGFGMKVIAYDPFPIEGSDIEYLSLDELFTRSDVISLHCPLTEQTRHILNAQAFNRMKHGVIIINTSRGELIDSSALLYALNNGNVRGAGLDVYEEEADFFFEDFSSSIMRDDILALLVSRPNVLLTSHQGFFTEEAMNKIAQVTLANLDEYFGGFPLTNEVCYRCEEFSSRETCTKAVSGRCF